MTRKTKNSPMDKIEVSAEELASEQLALQEGKEEEIRAKVIEDFAFDEVDDSERIQKAVEKEIEGRKALSQAIGQKIKHRTEAEELRAKVVVPPKPAVADEDLDKKLDEKLNARLEKMDLDSLSYPDDLKAEIKKVAAIRGVSIKEAAKDPYIVSKIEAVEKERDADEGAISRTNKNGGKAKASLDSPPDVDMNTEEGRKAYDKWFEGLKKAGE